MGLVVVYPLQFLKLHNDASLRVIDRLNKRMYIGRIIQVGCVRCLLQLHSSRRYQRCKVWHIGVVRGVNHFTIFNLSHIKEEQWTLLSVQAILWKWDRFITGSGGDGDLDGMAIYFPAALDDIWFSASFDDKPFNCWLGECS